MSRTIMPGVEVAAEPDRVSLRLDGGAWKAMTVRQAGDLVMALRRAVVEATLWADAPKAETPDGP